MKVSAFLENIRTGAQSANLPLEKALSRIQAAGLETVYVGRDSIAELGQPLFEMLKKLGLPVEGLHGWFNFADHPEGEDWKGFLDTASQVGAGHVLFVPGLVDTDDLEARRIKMENMVKVLRQAVAYGRERGIAVTMENLDQITAPYCSVAGLSWFFSQVEGLQCCYDTGNFIIHRENELTALEGFLDNLAAIHVKDRSQVKLHAKDDHCQCADGGIMYPAPVGYGCMQISGILDKLKEVGYTGSLIAELYGYDPDFMLEGMEESVAWLKNHI